MKICEFSEWELMHTAFDGKSTGVFISNPMMNGLALIQRALETVNQAGLDGKKLTDMKVIHFSNPADGPDGGRFEVHAKVRHRLSAPAMTNQPDCGNPACPECYSHLTERERLAKIGLTPEILNPATPAQNL
jgi:hypothetical protein